MIKTFLIAIFVLYATAQPDVRKDINGTEYNSAIPNWSCTVRFNDKGEVKYTETLNADDSDASNGIMNPFNSDHLDTITWQGTACNCWVIVFQDAEYDGNSLGLWLGNTTGTIDLTKYTFMDDSDLITNDDYLQWNEVVSSYHIYCF